MAHDADPTPDYRALGAALRARREELRMTRQDVTDAGGPSPATIQRIEDGKIKTRIEPATKEDLEKALQLERGWIDGYLTRASPGEHVEIAAESDGERILVQIAEGVSRMSLTERQAVLAVVDAVLKRER